MSLATQQVTINPNGATVFTEALPKAGEGIQWEPNLDNPGEGVLTIRQGRRMSRYLVEEFSTPWDGRAVELAKLAGGTDPEAERYSVFVHHGGQDHLCDCKGFTRHGHCKHVESVRSLLENGWLDLLVEPDERDGSPF